MLIINNKTNESLDDVCLLLKREEAEELRDSLNQILTSGSKDNHTHNSNADYSKEVTIALYGGGLNNGFSEAIKNIIQLEEQNPSEKA